MQIYILKVLFSALLGIMSILSFCTAQPISKVLDKEEQDLILEKTGLLLKENYVFADVGTACADFLSAQQNNSTYQPMNHPRAFVRQLNTDLRRIHRDKHIRIQYISEQDRKISELDPLLNFFLHTRDKIKANLGIMELKILSGNVGYINIRVFEPLELGQKKILAAMHFLQNSDALIIDLRDNSGGNPAMIQFICSWFFDKPTHLNSIYWRKGDYVEEFWSMDQIGIDKKPDIPLFILLSKDTFSGGEEFAYNLKIQKRAILIGETTAGGANPGYTFRINERFSIFIPTGHSINPITNDNWEGRGVIPDFVTSGRDALSSAHEKARHDARIYREKSDDNAISAYLSFSSVLKDCQELLSSSQKDSALSLLKMVLKKHVRAGLIGEWHINDLAYRYISKKKFALAMALMLFNIRQFPDSFNVYDSMGELYMKLGNTELAIENYKKSLSLNPQNQNARMMLTRLNKMPP